MSRPPPGSGLHFSVLRRPKPYFATTQVPIEANTATAIPDGIVVLFVPEPLTETKSGPHTAQIATTTHIAVIASDAHISGTSTSPAHRRFSGAIPEEGCDAVDISHLLFSRSVSGGRICVIRARTDVDARNYVSRVDPMLAGPIH